MTRIPVLDRSDRQGAAYDKVAQNNARVGFGPAIGYAYSPESGKHIINRALIC